MRHRLVRVFYHISKALGLFHLARVLTSRAIRILCYHGFALNDENRFRPRLYMNPGTFVQRLDFLRRQRFPVLSLDEALARQSAGDLPRCATVITIDDGFYSVYARAYPELVRRSFPATLYVTSYYFAKGTPVFGICVHYMLWKARAASVDLSRIGVPALATQGAVNLASPEQRERIGTLITDHGYALSDDAQRTAIARSLGQALNVDHEDLVAQRRFSLVSPAELKEMADNGIGVALHTHRHQLPTDIGAASAEIQKNHEVLRDHVDCSTHFCYPSGDWSPAHWPALQQCGVASATTCDAGLVYAGTPRLRLNRILDDDQISQIEFEAELYGFTELLRILRRRLGRPWQVRSYQTTSSY